MTKSHLIFIIISEVIIMAKKKTKPPLINNLQDTHIVTKSRPLMLMKEVPFALGELKVLDTYLSRINAKDPTATKVRFTKEEYEDLMGVERMHPERLNKHVTALQGKTVKVPDKTARRGWRNYTLFDESAFDQDDDGQWWIELSCTPAAKKLFFNIDSIGYIRYQLKNVLPLTSKYSVLLYIYLLDNRFRVSWDVSLSDLRENVLHCNSDFYAASYKDFKRDILEKAIKEVNEKTDLTFKYEPVKKGRPVVAIKFTLVKDLVTLPLEDDPHQLKLFPADGAAADPFGFFDAPAAETIDAAAVYRAELPEHLTDEEVDFLVELAKKHVPFDMNFMAPELATASVLREKVLLMKAQKKPVKQQNQFSWLRRAIAEDWD